MLDYKVLNDSFTECVTEALDYVKKQGYAIDQDVIDSEITFGIGKPSAGNTHKFNMMLKNSKKALHMQVFNRGYTYNNYELNIYIL